MVLGIGSSLLAQNQGVFFQNSYSTFSIELETTKIRGAEIYGGNGASGASIGIAALDSMTLLAKEDAYISSDRPDENFGSLGYLKVKGIGGKSRGRFSEPLQGFAKAALLKFDVPVVKGKIIEAKLELFALSSGYGGGVFFLNPNEDQLQWHETSVTWNDRPVGLNELGDPGTFLDYLEQIEANQWYAFDVSGILEYSLPEWQFCIVAQTGWETLWASRESPYSPRLKIYYVPEPDSVRYEGEVLYSSGGKGIPNVLVQVYDDTTQIARTFSDTAGFFHFSVGKHLDTVRVIPSKPAFEDVSPTSIIVYDAALTARHALGLNALDSLQQKAADADLDGNVLVYDAALIARYAVGIQDTTQRSKVGFWTFVPAVWYLFPSAWTNGQLLTFRGVLIGDVDNSWQMNKPASLAENVVKVKKSLQKDSLLIEVSVAEPVDVLAFQAKVESSGLDFGDATARFISKIHPGVNSIVHAGQDFLQIGAYSGKKWRIGQKVLEIAIPVYQRSAIRDGDLEIIVWLDNQMLRFSGMESNQGLGAHPTSFSLSPAYPNPSNHSIRFKVDIPQLGELVWRVYDVQGRIVVSRGPYELRAGSHCFTWNGVDESGMPVSSGVYFLVVEFMQDIRFDKLLILK